MSVPSVYGLRRGQLVQLGDRKTWKLAIVVDLAPRAEGKVRACVWSANRSTWSQPQLFAASSLVAVAERPEPDPGGRRRRAILEAVCAVDAAKGWVCYRGGSMLADRMWVTRAGAVVEIRS